MKEQNCDDLDLLAYLTGALNDTERDAVDAHLRSCPNCRADLKQLQEAESLLTSTLKPVMPPDSLREKVFAEAFAKRPPTPQRVVSSTSPDERIVSRPLVRTWIPWSVTAALLIGCATLVHGLIVERHQVSHLEQQLANSATAVALQPTHYLATARGHAIVIRAKDGVQLIVSVSNVKPTTGSQVYHVWLWNKGVRESAGTMTVSANGTGVLEVSLRGSKAVFDGIGITLEPNPTTKVPTGPKVLGVARL